MRAADGKSHFLQNPRHAVADRGRGSKGQIDDAKLGVQTFRRLSSHHLSHTGNLEGSLLDRLGDNVKLFTLAELQRMMNHARSGNADAHDTLRLADTVECASHKGIVLYRIAEHDELCAAQTVLLARQMRRFLDDSAHPRHRVHVDASFRRADVYARTDQIRLRQRLRNRAQQLFIARGEALLHQRGKAADEVDAARFCSPVHREGKGHKVLCLTASGDKRHRRDGDALVDNRNAELALNGLARLDEIFRLMADLIVNLFAAAPDVLARAVEQRDAHRNRADVEMLLIDHIDRVNDLL